MLCYRVGVYTLIISSDWLLSHFAAADGKHRVVPVSVKPRVAPTPAAAGLGCA